MPVILPKEKQDEWLMEIRTEQDKERLLQLARPLDEGSLKAVAVQQLLGKSGVGNSVKAAEPYRYPGLLLEL
jgi:putative SOS response-associated peptidase YedK